MLKEMDAPLVELARRSDGDLRKLLYTFFSFLNRRTDFYCIPHDDDAGKDHRLGFKEGEAEKLLLAAFRQFPLRKMPKQTAPARDPPGKTTTTTTTATTTKTTTSSSSSSGSSSHTTSAPTTTTTAAAAVRGTTMTETSTAATTTSRKERVLNRSETDDEDPMASTRFTDEGKQYPVGNGGSTKSFRWTQTLDEVTVILALPRNTTRGKDLTVMIKSNAIAVTTKKTTTTATNGEVPSTIIAGALTDKINPEESTWSIEGGVVLLILQKVRKTWWDSVLVGDPKIDTSLVDSRRRIDEYDDSTQGAIRRILFDQRQQRLGKPTSDQILRQQGINPIPPLPPGVEYIDNETLTRAEQARAAADHSRSEA